MGISCEDGYYSWYIFYLGFNSGDNTKIINNK